MCVKLFCEQEVFVFFDAYAPYFYIPQAILRLRVRATSVVYLAVHRNAGVRPLGVCIIRICYIFGVVYELYAMAILCSEHVFF